MVDHVHRALSPAVDSVILVSSDPSAPGWLPGVPVVPDHFDIRSSLTGVHAALSQGHHVVVVAWDMPGVTTTLLSLLAEGLRDGASAVVPVVDGRPEGACAGYSAGCAGIAEAQLRAGDLSLSRFIDRIAGVRRIEGAALRAAGDPAVMLANINTPGDLAAVRARAVKPA
jgi:molybdenum cofactor guanylyltransferase